MAWLGSGQTPVAQGPSVQKEESVALPSATGTGYSSEINFLKVDPSKNNKYFSIMVSTSTVSGSNIDFALYGAYVSGGTKYQLLDAIVADHTTSASATNNAASVDLNAYPAPYYYIGWTVDANESANTVSVYITYN
jgi:hypothetical protein